jgi:hypothetical protein
MEHSMVGKLGKFYMGCENINGKQHRIYLHTKEINDYIQTHPEKLEELRQKIMRGD